jgi:hypothetical protein
MCVASFLVQLMPSQDFCQFFLHAVRAGACEIQEELQPGYFPATTRDPVLNVKSAATGIFLDRVIWPDLCTSKVLPEKA